MSDVRATLEGSIFTSQQLREAGFAHVGENVRVHSKANIFGLDKISLGDNVQIGPFVNISASAPIRIGSYVHIAGYAHLSASCEIVFEDFSCVSQAVKVYTMSDDFSGEHMTNPTIPDQYLGVREGPVRIGRHSLVGAGSIVLPGCDIAEGVAVGSLSLVVSSLEAWGVYAGIPARRIKARSKRLLELEKAFLAER